MNLLFWRKKTRKMDIGQLFQKYQLEKVKINLKVMSAEVNLNRADEDAA